VIYLHAESLDDQVWRVLGAIPERSIRAHLGRFQREPGGCAVIMRLISPVGIEQHAFQSARDAK
jgi:hypothetical protein